MLLTLAMRTFAETDQPYYIIPPRRRLLTMMGGIFLALTVLLALTYTVTAVVTIPLLMYLGFVFFLYARVWCAFRYSRAYMIALPVISFLLSFLFKYFLYQYA